MSGAPIKYTALSARDQRRTAVFLSAIIIVHALIFGGTLIALHLTY